jgi:hypothetical protein
MVQTGPEIKCPSNFWFGFQMAIQKLDYFVWFSTASNFKIRLILDVS